MSKSWKRWAEDIWYREAWLGIVLLPLAYVFSDIVRLRRFCYRHGLVKSTRLPVPVIVVGNITVGGTGKTPLVIWLAQALREAGFKPGIISRGYGGRSALWPRTLTESSRAEEVGDEACLIFQQTGLSVVVGPDRVASAKKLLSQFDCTVLISDDGLQHYKLHRDVEIIVVDGDRRFGNGYMLPAGPLREPASRLAEADAVVANGEKYAETEYAMQLQGDQAVNLVSGEIRPLTAFVGSPCHAVAAIGNPERFFKSLASLGLACTRHSFSDHYAFQPGDLAFGDGKPVLMTGKDAVKCLGFAQDHYWAVPVSAVLETGLLELILNRLSHPHD